MATIMDYLKWRGDLTFSQSPFCEIDNLILACLSYVNLDGIVTSEDDAVTLSEISRRFFKLHTLKEVEDSRSFIRKAPFLLREMAQTQRFTDAKICHYTNTISEQQEVQFSAMEIIIGDDTSYISFRGTDDNLVGWREDFNMSTGLVPAQTAASEYLVHVMSLNNRKVRVGGHSKGGNLALYASVKCLEDLQERILHVYNNDGPGFLPELMDEPGLARITPKLTRFVPHFSIFGMLLEHTTEPVIVESDNHGVMQHDAFSWQLNGPAFLRRASLHTAAVLFGNTMPVWLAQMDKKDREQFIEDLFSVLEASGYKTIPELEEHAMKAIPPMLKQLRELRPETRNKIESLIKILISQFQLGTG